MVLKEKRDNISEKLDDAKQLKEGIDHRGNIVSSFLQDYLNEEQYHDYQYFVNRKSQLNMQRQDVEDRIKLGQEQLAALKKSLKR